MKQISISILSLFLFLALTTSALAHSGCCSHHLGVRADGCGCNDGTPLSDTCAPYYTCTAPQDNTTSTTTNTNYYQPVYVAPTDTPIPPTYTPIPPTNTPTLKPTAKPTSTPIPIKNTPTPTIAPTTAVLGAREKADIARGFFVVLLAPIVIIGSLWWGRRALREKENSD